MSDLDTPTDATGPDAAAPADVPGQPVYFASGVAEAEYIINYLGSNQITATAEPDPEHPACSWVVAPEPDVRRALQVLAAEREGKLDEKGVEAIRAAMGFSGGQFVALAVWSLLLLGILLLAAFCFGR